MNDSGGIELILGHSRKESLIVYLADACVTIVR